MRTLLIATSVVLLAAVAPVRADGPAGAERPIVSPGDLSPTPEMWFYQQYMQQYLDSNAAVRRNAEFRAEMRMRRLAAMKWFGFSNQRPRATVDPLHNDYSPGWTSNNPWYPDRWSGVGWTPYLLSPHYVVHGSGTAAR